MAIEGRVTGIAEGAIRGWLAAGATDEPGYLEALVDGEGIFGRTRATPGEDGRLHFSIPIPEALRDGRMRFLDVRALGSDRPLAGGPVIYDGGLLDGPAATDAPTGTGFEPPPFLVEGQVTFTPPDLVEGWAWAPDEPGRRLQLEITAGGRVIAQITADKLRDELKADGVGDGLYGFRVDLSRLLRRGPHAVTIRVAGFNEPLPGGALRVGPFAADGEVDCPGYLDDDATRRRLASLPFEHLAYNAQRIAPERLAPRLINRLRRERMAWTDTDAGETVLLVLPGGNADEAAALWALQSYPHAALHQAADAATIRDVARRAAWLFFAGPGDVIHPSAAAIVARIDGEVVLWGRFVADEARAGSAGTVYRRPPFDPATVRHGAVSDTTLTVRGEVLAGAPDAVLAALAAGRLHPLWFWLAGRDLRWRGLDEALTSSIGDRPALPCEAVQTDDAVYRAILSEEGGGFSLERTSQDLPFPYALVPLRRAATVSVLLSFRGRVALTLRCINAVARQRLSGELELVLVDNQSTPAEAQAVLDGARRLLGVERVTALSYDAPFSHSAQNNLATRAARGEAIVFCNNDVVLREPTLLEQLAAWSLQDGVGAVGCRLEDPERGIGSHGHIFAPPSADPFQPLLRENPDPSFGRHVHACPGVTLALAAMDRARFLDLGGLDETDFPIGYNDIDLMLRASRAGLTHLYLGHLDAEHARGSSRTGDNEDAQSLLIRQRFPEAALGYLHQLSCERIETARPELQGERRTDDPGVESSVETTSTQDAELTATLQSTLEARRALEARRTEIARSLLAGSDLLTRLGDQLRGDGGPGGASDA